MSEIRCNDSSVLSLYLDMPFTGAWTAMVESDDDVVPVGAATITLHQENGNLSTFSGTVTWGATWQGRSKYTVVGGAGTLNTGVPAKNYLGSLTVLGVTVPLNALLIVENLLVSLDVVPPVAEVIEPATATLLATKSLGVWHVGGQQRGRCISNLAKALELNWRIIDIGQLSMFVDEWPAVDTDPYVVDPGDNGISRTISIAPDGAPYRPGTTILGRKVYRVTYNCTPDATRGTLFYMPAGA